jgi:hypothetical protein
MPIIVISDSNWAATNVAVQEHPTHPQQAFQYLGV